MGRAYRGLYGLKQIQFGNSISFSNKKSRRSWKPNVQTKTFYSELLEKPLRFRMTTSVMKQIKRMRNGIDEYILKTPNEVLLYDKAIEYKRLMKAKAKRIAKELQQRSTSASRPTSIGEVPSIQTSVTKDFSASSPH